MTTPRACVVGWPAKHSRSPLIHGYWLRQLAIAGEYGIEEVSPEGLASFLQRLRENGYVGCNVTVPHKEAALKLADHADGAAWAVGAANTLWLEDGRLMAANSDVSGFLASLDEARAGWERSTGQVVVLGAGGAARGIVWGLVARGVPLIHVVNRNIARAQALASGYDGVAPAHWAELPGLLGQTDMLVNATTLGMTGEPPLIIDLEPLPSQALVADIVYVPLKTDLLRTAQARGNPTVDGLGMLLHQAVPGFERWFGKRPVVTSQLRRMLAANIESG